MSKENERFGLERQEFDRQMYQFEQLEDRYGQLSAENQELIEVTKGLQASHDVLLTERTQLDV